MTRRLSRPLPSTEPPQLWLRHPFVALCSGAELSLHTLQDRALDDSSLLTHHSHCTLPAAYCQPRAGLGGNALHGFDIRAGWLAGGTTTGSILLIPLHPEGALQREAMRVLEGHAKVVSWLCIHTSGERLYSSSFDRTIREWSLSDMTCLQTVKIGSPVLQLKLFPPSGGDDAQLLVGCGDGTIKLWDPQQRKAQKAIRTLRFTHREYVGALLMSGERFLSCSRSGEVQLWRADAKSGFVTDEEALPLPMRDGKDDGSWRYALNHAGVLVISSRGAVSLLEWGASEAIPLTDDALPTLVDSPGDSLCYSQAHHAGNSSESGCTLLIVGISARKGEQQQSLEVLLMQVPRVERDAAAEKASPPMPVSSWSRWQAVAHEENIEINQSIQDSLTKMETIAKATGRELTEISVRNFLRRSVQ